MPTEPCIRRLMYASRATGDNIRDDCHAILRQSRPNNGIDGITGILWTDGDRYLQLLEGPPDSVARTFDRILRDPRHTEVSVLRDDMCVDRQFGDWTMAALPDEAPDDAAGRLSVLLHAVDADVSRFFVPG
ncbi:BLUF domain-containing protein [Sphingomonas sp.]|uniref:BLUF domain-containing protein n=1 Tax=Sphingomonas sp. TaxID=28214 RepID=UPI0035C87824